ncbi:MAG: hypothetical protein MAG431_01889 [Chloroflexi bacterium]|nr:hypothetical protein [Chloroflexota bacterium]
MKQKEFCNFKEWTETVPSSLKKSPLWDSKYYQLSMYLYDLVWRDCQKLRKDFRGRAVSNQIIRSSGSICANQEEAYGRGVGTADYIRVLRIALGEARETQGWYFRSRHILNEKVINHRTVVLDQIIALLVTNIQSHSKNLRNS